MKLGVSPHLYIEIARLGRESFVRPGLYFKDIILHITMRGGGDSAILLSNKKKKEVKVF